MGIDWENILDAEGEDLTDAYEDHLVDDEDTDYTYFSESNDDYYEDEENIESNGENLTSQTNSFFYAPNNHPYIFPNSQVPPPQSFHASSQHKFSHQPPAPQKINLDISYLYETKRAFYLYHFTPLENLASILQFDLLPKQITQQRGIPSIARDSLRTDNLFHCTSFSISHPNYKLLYKRKYDNPPNNSFQDIILQFYTKDFINLQNEMYFFPGNAAKSEYNKQNLLDHQGIRAVDKIFEEEFVAKNSTYHRSEIKSFPDYYPSNPEAEIMVDGAISANLIKKIFVHNHKQLQQVNNILKMLGKSQIKVEIDTIKYNRPDHWKIFDTNYGAN